MINKLVSVNNVIVNLIDSLGLEHNKYKPMFVNWALSAERKIGSYYSYERKICVLNITNCYAELPCDAAYLQLAVLGDHGCECGDLFDRLSCFSRADVTSGNLDSVSFLVVDLPASSTSTGDPFFWNAVNYHVQDNKIIFSRDCDAQKVTIQYLGIQTDKDGIPLVGMNHLEAIEEYCMYKFRRRKVRSGIDVGLYRDHKNEWERLCAEARGDDAEISDSERARIVNKLYNPLVGRGLQLEPNGGYIY